VLVPGAVLTAALLWAYWPTMRALADRWLTDPQYSHGFLVPLFAALLLWQRRERLRAAPRRPSWMGVPLLVAAGAMRLAGGYYYSPWLEQVSLLPAVAGLVVTAGGRAPLAAVWPALAFLLFMVPLPGRLDKALAAPLQRVATLASTNAIQTLGFFAHSEGNVIVLGDDYELGIVEACSGLRMLTVFLATAVAVAATARRSLRQRVIIVLSAVPVALLCNVIRITATGVLHETAGHEAADLVYHNLAGWLMAPLALVFLGAELLVLGRLFVAVPDAPPPAVPPWHPAAVGTNATSA
jgi:exosortase